MIGIASCTEIAVADPGGGGGGWGGGGGGVGDLKTIRIIEKGPF